MTAILGYITLGLVVLAIGKYIVRKLPVPPTLKRKLVKFFKKLHPFAGIGAVLLGLYHGYRAYGLNFLFTGHILWISILMVAILGILADRKLLFKKKLIVLHKLSVVLVILMFLLHYFNRYIL